MADRHHERKVRLIMSPPFRFVYNLTIIGAPGSGKGFYGRLLAQAWGVPLITTSDVLRQAANIRTNLLDKGKLVDCQVVSNVLLGYLLSLPEQHYILDGFPRTRLQIQLMTQTWPSHLQVQAALHLNIPDAVCQQKLMGRRHCCVCRRNYPL